MVSFLRRREPLNTDNLPAPSYTSPAETPCEDRKPVFQERETQIPLADQHLLRDERLSSPSPIEVTYVKWGVA